MKDFTDIVGVTSAQAVERFENGESIWTCEMGSLGEEYERAIQILGFAFLKEMLADPFDSSNKQWKDYIDDLEKTANMQKMMDFIAPTGAMYSAAVNLASVFANKGYEAGMNSAPESRRILINNNTTEWTI